MEIVNNIEVKSSTLLIQAIDNSIEFFDVHTKCHVLKTNLQNLKTNVENCEKIVVEIESFASDYDFDNETPGNGYRSFIDVFKSAVKKTTKICNQLIKNREKILFREIYYTNEVNEWNEIFTTLSTICSALIVTHQNSDPKNLFLKSESYDNIIFQTFKAINQKPFFANNIGFYLCRSMRPIVKFIVVSMSCYFSFYFKDKSKALKILRFPVSFAKHHTMSQKRAVKCVNAYNNSTTEFCRSFWFLQEGKIMHSLSSLTATNVEVNKVFEIQPEPLQLYSDVYDKVVNIPLPLSHIGLAPVCCRLISAKKRQGMLGVKTNSKTAEPSNNLIFHVHGGGWAAQTSKSHEKYMRDWAVKLDAPILSIDYSLLPKAPFPRALEEIFYAYCWALKNSELVGSTCENIVFVGDSAGGNLVTACVIKCIEAGIKKPTGLFNIYAPFQVDFTVTPSKFISMIDPILSYGLSTRIFKSYGELRKDSGDMQTILEPKKPKRGKPKNAFKSQDEEFDVIVNQSYLLSPYKAPDEILAQFPPTKFMTSNFDPCLDDCIQFGKKLRKLQVKTSLNIVKSLPHGFLYFFQASKECRDATMLCADQIGSLL